MIKWEVTVTITDSKQLTLAKVQFTFKQVYKIN